MGSVEADNLFKAPSSDSPRFASSEPNWAAQVSPDFFAPAEADSGAGTSTALLPSLMSTADVSPQVFGIASLLSLRPPQRRSLEILDQVCSALPLCKITGDQKARKATVQLQALGVLRLPRGAYADRQRAEVPLVVLRTGHRRGKRGLMGASCAYLYQAPGL